MSEKRSFIIHSPNWLGDVIMAFPAFRLWRNANMDAAVYIIAKKKVAGLWNYVSDVNGIITIDEEKGAMKRAAAEIRKLKCQKAILLPHSFRSAFQVWRGGVPEIRGTAGQFRSFFISDEVSISHLANAHQAFEYMHQFGLALPGQLDISAIPSPSLAVDKSKLPAPTGFNIDFTNSLVILPGAARGSSKRWPPEFFTEVAASALRDGLAKHILVCGTPGEASECEAVATALTNKNGISSVTNLCGKTKLGELAFVLSKCRAVCSNDSGGMHLATAMGAPVVAVFGITDPGKTGPLGRSAIVAAEGVKASRAVPRESEEATRALRSVKPERVYGELRKLIANE